MKRILSIINKHRYVFMSCLLAILVVILIVVIVCFNSDKSKTDTVNSEYDNSESLTTSHDGLLSGDSRFLVICNGENPGEIVFMTLVEFRIYSETIIVTPLSAETDVSGSSYGEYYSYGGISMLKNAVESTRQCKIDRYVIMDEDGFCEIIDMLGKVSVFVEEEYTYASSDKSYTVSVGENELESHMLFSYINVLSQKNDNLTELADLFCLIVNEYIPDIDADDAQDYFEDLCNCVNTDVSIADYYSCSADIAHLLTENAVCVPYMKESNEK